MAIKIMTASPKAFLNAIRTAIDNDSVRTWEYDKEGRFNHTPKEWSGKALIRARVEEGRSVTFLILAPDGKDTINPAGAYGVFQGRFVEMLTNHFRSKFKWMAVGKVNDLPS